VRHDNDHKHELKLVFNQQFKHLNIKHEYEHHVHFNHEYEHHVHFNHEYDDG
jgi:hypothetical protein